MPGIFSHFDEVWLFDAKPVAAPDARWSLVAPFELSPTELKAAVQWMACSGCLAGLGDGEGLNALVAERAADVIQVIEEARL